MVELGDAVIDVPEAEAQLALAKASAAHREAKSVYRSDQSEKNRKALKKGQQALIEARDEWRIKWRRAPAGPGDATATPEPATLPSRVT